MGGDRLRASGFNALAVASVLGWATAYAAEIDDIPEPSSVESALLVVRHEVMLKEPLDLRPTPTSVEIALFPGGARRVYADQRFTVFEVPQGGEYIVHTATVTFRPKRMTGLVGQGRSERPVEVYALQVHQYPVGEAGIPVQAGTVTHGGTLMLTLRRVAEDNQQVSYIAPTIVDGRWKPFEVDDEEWIAEKLAKSAWSRRPVVKVE